MRSLSQGLPLWVRVPLLVASLMVLLGIVASQQVLTTVARVQEARLREIAQLHIDGLAVALGPAVLRQDVWEVYDTLDRAAQAADGHRMRLTVVADEAERVLAATDPRAAPVDSQLGALTEGARSLEDIDLGGDATRLRVLSPLSYQGRTVGQVLTELDISDLVAERTRLLWLLLLGNALVTVLMALGGYLAVRRMMQPIRLLTQHMDATDGRPAAIPLSSLPSRDPELTRLLRTYNDMAAAAEAKAEAERQLAEKERYASLGRLSSSLAHEINNPLGGLLNAADTILTYADRPDVVRDSGRLIERGLRHLRDVARATLDQHRLGPEAAPLGPDDLEDLRLLLAPEARRQDQSLDWRVAATADSLGRLPAAPVRQIALNLLLNGSHAAGMGGEVGLEVEDEAGELRLTFRNSGPGLPDLALRRLLTQEAGWPGGGLGLKTVRELVLSLGGRIEHARNEGRTAIRVIFAARAATLC